MHEGSEGRRLIDILDRPIIRAQLRYLFVIADPRKKGLRRLVSLPLVQPILCFLYLNQKTERRRKQVATTQLLAASQSVLKNV